MTGLVSSRSVSFFLLFYFEIQKTREHINSFGFEFLFIYNFIPAEAMLSLSMRHHNL